MPQNDFILPVSFHLAQNIGLEESVLLAFLQQKAFLNASDTLQVNLSDLAAQLSFWTPQVLLRFLSSLQTQQRLTFERTANTLIISLIKDHSDIRAEVVPAQSTYVANTELIEVSKKAEKSDLLDKVNRLQRESKQKSIPKTESLPPLSPHRQQFSKARRNEVATTSPVSQTTVVPNATQSGVIDAEPTNRRGVSDFDLYLEQQERTRQPDQWQPETATLEQIAQAGIPSEFAIQLQTEFLLRIKEQRKNVRTWNSEFFKYVKRQWQYKQTDRSSYEGAQSSTHYSRTSKEQVSDALSNIHDTDW